MIDNVIFRLYSSYGLSCIPCEEKRPLISWKQYQTTKPSSKYLDSFKGPQIACICGSVSGGLICIDFDTKNGDRFPEWQTIVSNAYPELLSKLVIEKTPSGGYHVIYRSVHKIGNLKLASTVNNMCMIETRGEGGYFVCAPSDGYEFYYNDFSMLASISESDSELLISAAVALDEKTKQEYNEPKVQTGSGLTPFDDFNAKCDIVSLLEKHGWNRLFVKNGATFLRRPGKDRGISATWNRVPDRFYCFTTSTAFENQHVYKASAVYAILEHGGDYHIAAKELYRLGYGERQVQKQKQKDTPVKAVLFNSKDMKNRIIEIKNKGYQRGKSTGWRCLDTLLTLAKRQFTVVTGVPSAGKSEFMDALSVNLVVNNNWKFAVFSPENYPVEMHYHKLIEKICGNELRDIPDDDIDVAIETINKYYFFIDALEDDLTLESILEQTKELVETKQIDALIIDPWNEIELSRPNNISESDFIGVCLRKARKFARKYNIHLFIVAHPTKLQKNKDGQYPIPELWDISGSAHWRNKADNGLCVHRDYKNECVKIIVQKVKFKYFGRQGDCTLFYEEKSGRYLEEATTDNVAQHWQNR